MCFSLVFACLSVSGWISGASPCYTSQTTFLPTLETESKEAWSPSSEGTSRQGCSTLAPESSMCVWVCICMYVHGGPVCKYVQGGRGGHCHRGWSRGLLEAGPAWTASSQVDPPQVSRGCDGVALRAELLGTQSPKPTLFTVHMPTLDRRQRHRV